MFRDLHDEFYIIPVFYSKYHLLAKITQEETLHKPEHLRCQTNKNTLTPTSRFVLWLNRRKPLVVGNWAYVKSAMFDKGKEKIVGKNQTYLIF